MYEHKSKPLLSKTAFAQRMVVHVIIALGVAFAALFIGMLGYHGFESRTWIDSLLNAAMILGGMGPVTPVVTEGGKIFAACYALFSGLVTGNRPEQ